MNAAPGGLGIVVSHPKQEQHVQDGKPVFDVCGPGDPHDSRSGSRLYELIASDELVFLLADAVDG